MASRSKRAVFNVAVTCGGSPLIGGRNRSALMVCLWTHFLAPTHRLYVAVWAIHGPTQPYTNLTHSGELLTCVLLCLTFNRERLLVLLFSMQILHTLHANICPLLSGVEFRQPCSVKSGELWVPVYLHLYSNPSLFLYCLPDIWWIGKKKQFVHCSIYTSDWLLLLQKMSGNSTYTSFATKKLV